MTGFDPNRKNCFHNWLHNYLPGTAFPDLYNDYRSKSSDLQNFFDSITVNKFGVPRYLPL